MDALAPLAQPSLNRRRPMGPQIAERLAGAVRAGTLQPGLRLPNEMKLAALFEVSRATVRDALVRLQADKLIETRRGKTGGAFVLPTAPAPAKEPTPAAAPARPDTLYAAATTAQASAALTSLFALERPVLQGRRRSYRAAQAVLFREIVAQTVRDQTPVAFAASFQRFHAALLDVADAVPLVDLGAEIHRASEAWVVSLASDPAIRRRIALAHAAIALAIQRGHLAEIETGQQRLARAMERRQKSRAIPRPNQPGREISAKIQ